MPSTTKTAGCGASNLRLWPGLSLALGHSVYHVVSRKSAGQAPTTALETNGMVALMRTRATR